MGKYVNFTIEKKEVELNPKNEVFNKIFEIELDDNNDSKLILVWSGSVELTYSKKYKGYRIEDYEIDKIGIFESKGKKFIGYLEGEDYNDAYKLIENHLKKVLFVPIRPY